MKFGTLTSKFHNYLFIMVRQEFLSLIEKHFQVHKVCALLGPRQCGKTTLSSQFAIINHIPRINIFDLEDPLDLQRLEEPILALADLRGFVIIDEIQYKPNLFPILRVLVDKIDVKFFPGASSISISERFFFEFADKILIIRQLVVIY